MKDLTPSRPLPYIELYSTGLPSGGSEFRFAWVLTSPGFNVILHR
jgi:hypothetical protein